MATALRERWTSRATFIFAAIGSAIGLGNVWRFPYLTYEYGGGVFLIPYIIGLILIGIPWMVMEFGMGRYFQRGAPGVFEGIGKKWEWLGWWPFFAAFLIVTYYTVVIAWCLIYTVSSTTVAWGVGEAGVKGAEGFFFNTVLGLSSGPGVLGGLQWPIVGMLLITWVIIFLIMFRGAKVIGKVSVWGVLIAWAFLAILVVRGLTLPGVTEGLNFYLDPNFSALANPGIWFAAFSQIAFSLSVGMAGMFAYGSFVAKKGDVSNSAVITSISDTSTSFFAGFAIFSTAGYIMQALNIPIQEVALRSMGLAFVGFPVAISVMPALNALIGVIFFLCLFFLGLTSAYFLAYGGVAVPLMDKFGWSRVKASLIVCVVSFIVGLLYATQGGLYWLDIVDRTASFYLLLITGALACIVIGWVFGAKKLREHVNETSDIKLGAWFDWLLKVIAPAGLLFVAIYGGFAQDIPKPYSGYPLWAASIIWILLVVTLVVSFILQAIKTRTPAGGEIEERKVS